MPTLLLKVGRPRCCGFLRNLADADVAALKLCLQSLMFNPPPVCCADSPKGHADFVAQSRATPLLRFRRNLADADVAALKRLINLYEFY